MFEFVKSQIASDYFQQRFSNDGQRFVAWYLRNVLFRDMNETRDDITDGADDKQIDAIIIDDDKSLVRIVQGKFIQSGTVDAEPLREVLSSWIQIKDLARLAVHEVGNLSGRRPAHLKRQMLDVGILDTMPNDAQTREHAIVFPNVGGKFRIDRLDCH